MNTLNRIKNGLVVSCQALEDEPLHSSEIMAKMALAAVEGGAVGIRANTVKDIVAIKQEVDVPVIGIIKAEYADSDVYITPTMREIDELISAKADIIAVDCTTRQRPGDITLNQFFTQVKNKYPNQLFMADCSTVEEVKIANDLGFDIVSSTLVGYTDQSKDIVLAADNYALIKEMMEITQTAGNFFIAEGNINTPEIMNLVLNYGVDCVVVGSMITRPQLITRKFTSMLTNEVKFIDMDGVLVDENANIDDQTIKKIQNSNFMPIINTGRLMHDIDYVVDKYNLSSNYKIAANGAHIQNRAGQDIVVHKLSAEVRDTIYKILRGSEFDHVRVEVNTTTNRYFFDERPIDFPKEFKDSAIVTDIDQVISDLDVIGFLVIFDDYTQISEQIEKLEKEFSGIVEFERSSQTSLEIYSSKASKGSAIKYLKDNKYIASNVKTSAYGDSFNDVSMFSEVDTSYAIKSHAEVEKQADKVINNLYEGL